MAKTAVLFTEMTPGASWEDEFNRWYDTEHIPPRMEAPGFINAQRYRNVDSPAHLALYDLESKGALVTPEYKQIKANLDETTRRILTDVTNFTRYIGEEIGCWKRPDANNASLNEAAFVYAVFFTVPATALKSSTAGMRRMTFQHCWSAPTGSPCDGSGLWRQSPCRSRTLHYTTSHPSMPSNLTRGNRLATLPGG
jgi:hypothetical protein